MKKNIKELNNKNIQAKFDNLVIQVVNSARYKEISIEDFRNLANVVLPPLNELGDYCMDCLGNNYNDYVDETESNEVEAESIDEWIDEDGCRECCGKEDGEVVFYSYNHCHITRYGEEVCQRLDKIKEMAETSMYNIYGEKDMILSMYYAPIAIHVIGDKEFLYYEIIEDGIKYSFHRPHDGGKYSNLTTIVIEYDSLEKEWGKCPDLNTYGVKLECWLDAYNTVKEQYWLREERRQYDYSCNFDN